MLPSLWKSNWRLKSKLRKMYVDGNDIWKGFDKMLIVYCRLNVPSVWSVKSWERNKREWRHWQPRCQPSVLRDWREEKLERRPEFRCYFVNTNQQQIDCNIIKLIEQLLENAGDLDFFFTALHCDFSRMSILNLVLVGLLLLVCCLHTKNTTTCMEKQTKREREYTIVFGVIIHISL